MEESRKLHSTKEVEYLARLAEMEKLLQEKEQKQKEVFVLVFFVLNMHWVTLLTKNCTRNVFIHNAK